jgi:hypothetical protein
LYTRIHELIDRVLNEFHRSGVVVFEELLWDKSDETNISLYDFPEIRMESSPRWTEFINLPIYEFEDFEGEKDL